MKYEEAIESKVNMERNKRFIDEEHRKRTKYSTVQIIGKIVPELYNTLRYSGLRRMLFKVLCNINKKLIFDKTAKYNPQDNYELTYQCENDFSSTRIAIYTAIFGGYDEVQEPLYISPCSDYYIFTDHPIQKNSVWRKLDVNDYIDTTGFDAYHISKIVKVLPHKIFKDYEYSIWIDGTTIIVADLIPFIDRLKSNFIAMFDNPVHDCIYTESNFLLYYNRVSKKDIMRQINYYKSEGYPAHNGMYECTVIVRKHNDAECISLMEDWWKEITTYTMRDQISMPYVLWKHNMNKEDVTILGDDRHFNPRLRFVGHKRTNTYK